MSEDLIAIRNALKHLKSITIPRYNNFINFHIVLFFTRNKLVSTLLTILKVSKNHLQSSPKN